MTQYWLGLDCGGSWLKAGLYDREGREAGVQRLPLCALSPQPGWAERDMAELWQCCMAVIRELLTHSGVSGEQIVGIGISAQGKGLFLLDKNNKPLGNAIFPAACCRICRNLRGDHRSDSRTDRSESGYARCRRPV